MDCKPQFQAIFGSPIGRASVPDFFEYQKEVIAAAYHIQSESVDGLNISILSPRRNIDSLLYLRGIISSLCCLAAIFREQATHIVLSSATLARVLRRLLM